MVHVPRAAVVALTVALPLTLAFLVSGCSGDDTNTVASQPADAASGDGALDGTMTSDGAFDAPSVSDAGDSTIPGETDGALEDAGDDGDAGSSDDASETGATDASEAGPVNLDQTGLRFANLVPDLAAGVDFCLAAENLPFASPYLQPLGVSSGLAYTQVSERVAMPDDADVKVRVVAAGSADCSTPLAGIADAKNIDASRGPWTIALIGTTSGAGAAPTLAAYVDDPPSPTTHAHFRVVHASPNAGALALSLGAGQFETVEQQGIFFGGDTSAATKDPSGITPDANGYLDFSVDVQVTAVQAGADVTSFHTGGAGGTSAFFIGLSGSATTPLAFLACDDAALPSAHLTACTVNSGPPLMTPLRFANLAPDGPTFDVCISSYAGPIRGPMLENVGVSTGLAFLQISGVATSVPAYSSLYVWLETPGLGCGGQIVSTLFYVPDAMEHTLALVESELGASFVVTDYVADPAATTGFAGSPTQAVASVANVVAEMPGETIDLLASLDGGAGPAVATAVAPGTAAATLATFDPGTYTLDVVADPDGGVLASSVVALAAGERVGMFWFHDAAGHGRLASCDLAVQDGGLATCGE
jgi:hypothetical protein